MINRIYYDYNSDLIRHLRGQYLCYTAIRYLNQFTYKHKEGTKAYCEKIPSSSWKYKVPLHLSTGLELMSFKDLGYQRRPHQQLLAMVHQVSQIQGFASSESCPTQREVLAQSPVVQETLKSLTQGHFLQDHKMTGFSYQ